MRKIVSGLFISLDSVVEAPDQWQFPYFNEEMGNAVQSLMEGGEAMLLGRRTYEEFAAYWPTSTDDFAGYMNGTPKYVVSNTLTSADWQNSTLVSGDVLKELARTVTGLVARYHHEGAARGRTHRVVVAIHPAVPAPVTETKEG